MSLRVSADERCLFCTTSARDYRIGGTEESDPEELEILWSTCLECGFSVPTSEHDPVQLYGGLAEVRRSLDDGSPHLILPAEAVVYFHPRSAAQLVNGCLDLGFEAVHFELLGDELVAGEYRKLWDEMGTGDTWIRSTNTIVVEYVRHRHPELVPHLAPIVPPAVALARHLRTRTEEPIVYAGLDLVGSGSESDPTIRLSIQGLEALFEEGDVSLEDRSPEFGEDPPERRRHLSVPGGLPLDLLEGLTVLTRRFRKIRDLRRLASVGQMLRQLEGEGMGFLDVLPFDGDLDHPSLGPHDELFLRRRMAEGAEESRSDEPVVEPDPDLDLSVVHEEAAPELSTVELEDVTTTFRKLDIPAHEVLTRGDDTLAMCPFYMGRRYETAVQDARHDALTGLYSFGAFEERFAEEVSRANRAGTRLALLLVDIDDFRSVNDRVGTAAGNRLLREVGHRLSSNVRHTDVVARFGSDEMAVILVDPDPEGAAQVAEKLRDRVGSVPLEVDGEAVSLTVSVGIGYHSGRTRGALTTEELLAEADTSLYIANAQGGDRVHPQMTEELVEP